MIKIILSPWNRVWFVSIIVALFFVGGWAYFNAEAVKSSHIKPVIPIVTGDWINDNLLRMAHLRSRVPDLGLYTYQVKMKDNLWKIAKKKKFSVHTLIAFNPQLKTYDLSVKQLILIPSRAGTLHIIQPGDTWEAVGKRYEIDTDTVRKANMWVEALVAGELLFIPDRRPDIDLMNEGMKEKYELRALFVSPLGGRLSSTFGKRKHPVTGQKSFHGGIDIAVKDGTWVGAAADGVVTVAGDGIGHYGKAVFIKHENGYETHYGHLSKIYVRVGQKVKARKLIARSGSTGRVTGPHLHFTIKRNGQPKDPLKFIW